ncbi:malonate decarboxylase holo-[acyl-carrier-protein] synthase [Acinetobacter rudis]|uniref:malonate decarboxylase holo-[acyl-carrier-protein] synthase n=1 Tax=Acinetobacter rudis TaxID=632955 RepID=UPI0033419520
MNRHDLIYLQAKDAFKFLDVSLTPAVQQKIEQMIQHNMPFTVCRQESEDYFKVAANCFVHGQKHRVALGLASAPALSHRPLPLSHLIDMFDVETKNILEQFILHLNTLNCSVYVYGSYACQYLYQEQFIHAHSDLDLLIESSHTNMFRPILQAIDQLKTQLPFSIDGEITLNKTQNISFNELIFALNQKQDSIIVKELSKISLASIAAIFGGNLNA